MVVRGPRPCTEDDAAEAALRRGDGATARDTRVRPSALLAAGEGGDLRGVASVRYDLHPTFAPQSVAAFADVP
eukprot:gene11228-63454_t